MVSCPALASGRCGRDITDWESGSPTVSFKQSLELVADLPGSVRTSHVACVGPRNCFPRCFTGSSKCVGRMNPGLQSLSSYVKHQIPIPGEPVRLKFSVSPGPTESDIWGDRVQESTSNKRSTEPEGRPGSGVIGRKRNNPVIPNRETGPPLAGDGGAGTASTVPPQSH